MMHRSDHRHERLQFSSLAEVTHWLAHTPQGPNWTRRESVTAMASQSWDLGVGYQGALRLARDGWPEGIKKLSALAATVPNKMTYESRYDVAGERPDVARFLSGDPSNMIHRGKSQKPKRAITIGFNVAANCGITSTEMWNYGAAMVALVDRLESRHVRVELLGNWAITVSGKRFGFAWTVKSAEDALDMGAVAFSLAHPAMMRRLGFAVMERSNLQTDPHYGIPDSTLRPTDFINIEQDALLIGGVGQANGACRTMKGALEFAKAAINRAAGDDIAELEELE